jgi:uncharacterized membrane protein YgaE (UPF0421/DUF939 family)
MLYVRILVGNGRKYGGVSEAARPVRNRVLDRLSASDPGLLRLMSGLRTVASIGLTLAVLAPFGASVPHLVGGAMTSMVSTFAIREKERRPQAVTLALGLPVALLAVTLASLLQKYVVGGDLFFLLLIFAAVYSRRFGDRGTALGLIGFQMYFVGATPGALPVLYAALTTGFACSAVVRFGIVRDTPEQVLRRLRDAFRARLAQLLSAQTDLLDAAPDELDSALDDVRRHTARLHESAMLVQGRLEQGTDDSAAAALVQRRVAEAEIAAERLGFLVLSARSAERADTLALHLPNAPAPAPGDRLPARDDVTRTLRRDLRALQLLVDRPAAAAGHSSVAYVRNRLLGYRDEDNVPAGPPAVQDVFRGIGEAAKAVLGLRLALDGPQDESDDSAATTRSREELDAEDAAIAGAEREAEEEPTGWKRPTTRAAVQVSVGSALAIVGGEFLSSQRWYWAVLTCWVVFLNTASTGEILVKGYRRVLGTVCGVVAGAGLAGLTGNHTWTAFALVLLLIFAMFYTAPLSYVLLSFFVTAMLGMLYTLLHTYSLSVLVLRIEETALGAVCGIVAAALVLPVRTDQRTDELLATTLMRLADVSEAAVEQLSGGPAVDLLDQARDLDKALDDLRASTKPLTHPITPLRGRRQTARYLVALLETCAYHARSLAATAELVPYSRTIAADPRLKLAGRRISHNIEVLLAQVREERTEAADGTRKEMESGPSLASLLDPGETRSPRPGSVTHRVLRHLQRLDEGVMGLARPLGVTAPATERAARR